MLMWQVPRGSPSHCDCDSRKTDGACALTDELELLAQRHAVVRLALAADERAAVLGAVPDQQLHQPLRRRALPSMRDMRITSYMRDTGYMRDPGPLTLTRDMRDTRDP